MSNIRQSILEKLTELNIDIYHYEEIVRCYNLSKLNIERSRTPDYTDGIHSAEFDAEVAHSGFFKKATQGICFPCVAFFTSGWTDIFRSACPCWHPIPYPRSHGWQDLHQTMQQFVLRLLQRESRT